LESRLRSKLFEYSVVYTSVPLLLNEQYIIWLTITKVNKRLYWHKAHSKVTSGQRTLTSVIIPVVAATAGTHLPQRRRYSTLRREM